MEAHHYGRIRLFKPLLSTPLAMTLNEQTISGDRS
jgi:hypothetical protein